MRKAVETAFAIGGSLANMMEGYLPRKSQIELAGAVSDAVTGGRLLVAEAPAGVGKSFGYGVPITVGMKEGRCNRVLIATSNIALQEQLVERDFPFIFQALGESRKCAVLKGRNNYLCWSALSRAISDEEQLLGGDSRLLEKMATWADSQYEAGEFADKRSLPSELMDSSLWSKVSCDEGACKGSECGSFERCFYYSARIYADSADIVVCNYHLLFAGVQLAQLLNKPLQQSPILPPFDVLVMDEAHRAADIARGFFGWRLTQTSFDRAGALLRKFGERGLAEDLSREGKELLSTLQRYSYSSKYRIRFRTAREFDGSVVSSVARDAAKAYRKLAASETDLDLRAELGVRADSCLKLSTRVTEAQQLEDPKKVYYIDSGEGRRPALCSKLVEVGPILREYLWSRTKAGAIVSATLRVGGTFNFSIGELGIPTDRVDRRYAPSPFDFRRQAILIVPEGMPDPTAATFPEAVGREVRKAVEAARGRTLALFTSRRVLEAARVALRGVPYDVLVQGDEPRTRLLERFRDDIPSVLLGLASFWEGIDVPGEALSCLVIDRLPFPRPDDPVLDATSEKLGSKAFFEYSVPRATMTFCQGFGRLIRTVDDKGVVVVLDKRLVEKSYGRVFLKSLPSGTRVSRNASDAAALLLDPDKPDPKAVQLVLDAFGDL